MHNKCRLGLLWPASRCPHTHSTHKIFVFPPHLSSPPFLSSFFRLPSFVSIFLFLSFFDIFSFISIFTLLRLSSSQLNSSRLSSSSSITIHYDWRFITCQHYGSARCGCTSILRFALQSMRANRNVLFKWYVIVFLQCTVHAQQFGIFNSFVSLMYGRSRQTRLERRWWSVTATAAVVIQLRVVPWPYQ